MMRLALAEIDLEHGGYIRAASAAELAADARKDLPPEELRPVAMATLLQAKGLAACGDAAAQAEAADSVQLFRRLGDRIGEAHATHVLALATALAGTASAYEEALRLSAEALAVYKELELWTCHCSVEVSMMRLRLESEKPTEAIQTREEALALLDGVRCNGMLKLATLSLLGQAHVDSNNPALGAQRIQELLPQMQPRGPRIHALVLDQLAGVLSEYQPQQAYAEISRALALPACAMDEDLEAFLRLRLSTVEVARGNDDEALRAIERSLSLWSKREERGEMTMAARYLSVGILLRMFDPKDALREASQVRAFFEDEGDKYRAGMALVAVATIAYARGGYDEGVDSLEVAKDLFVAAKDPRGEALALSTLSELYRSQQRYQEALDVTLRYKALAQDSGFKEDEIKALLVLAGLFRQQEDFKAAARAAREGLRLARHAGLQEQQVQLLLQCVQCSLTAASYGKARVSRNMMEETTRLAKDAVKLTSESGLPAGGWKRTQYGVALYWHANALALSSREEALKVISKIDAVCDATGDLELQAYATLLSAQIQLDTDKATAASLLLPVIQSFKKLRDETGQKFAEEVYHKATYIPVAAPRPALADVTGAEEQLQVAPAAPKLSPDLIRNQILELARDTVLSEDAIALDQPLMDLGMDSLTSVSFRNELQSKFKVELPVSLIFDSPSVNALTATVMEIVIS